MSSSKTSKGLPLMGAVFLVIQFSIVTIGPLVGVDEAQTDQILQAIPLVIGYTAGTGALGVWNRSKKRLAEIQKHSKESKPDTREP